MTKKENEFSKTLDDLDRKVSEINQEKKIQIKREKRIQKIIDTKEAEKKTLRETEDREAREHSEKTTLWIILSYGTVVFWILSFYFRKDPTEFWFNVIVAICYVGFYFMAKYSK